MAGPITWEMLRDLARFRAAKGQAISLYLNLDPSLAPTAGDAATRMNSLLAEGERVLDARREDLQRIARWFDDDFDRDGLRGVAVFASALDGLWTQLGAPAPVADAIRVDAELNVAP